MLGAINASRPLRILATFALAALGGTVFLALGLPTPFLAGAIVAVLAGILAGLKAEVPEPIRLVVFLFLGIVAGTTVRPEVLGEMAEWPGSFVLLTVTVGAVIAVTFLFLTRAACWDRTTALFASLPGALSFVLAAASDTAADLRRVALLQSFRVIALVLMMPPLFHLVGAAPDAPTLRPPASLLDLVLLLLAGMAGGALGHLTRIPGGLMLGALVASAAMTLTASAEGAMPSGLTIPALIALGATVASRITPEDRPLLPNLVLPTLGAFALGFLLSLAGAAAAVTLIGVGFGEALLAFAPGALEAIVSLAVALDADPAFVAAHHLWRFLAIAFSVPLLTRYLADRGG